jgi:hypothetical protein
MARTFSLGRLMLNVTLFCALCGFVVNYPEELRYVPFFGPTLIPALILAGFARYRELLLFFALLGLLNGIAVWPLLPNPTPWLYADVSPLVGSLAIFGLPCAFATIAAGSYLHVERCLLRLKDQQPQRQTHLLQSFE